MFEYIVHGVNFSSKPKPTIVFVGMNLAIEWNRDVQRHLHKNPSSRHVTKNGACECITLIFWRPLRKSKLSKACASCPAQGLEVPAVSQPPGSNQRSFQTVEHLNSIPRSSSSCFKIFVAVTSMSNFSR